MEETEKLEEIAMTIIANAGAARSQAFGALEAVKRGDHGAAEEMMGKAEAYLHTAHESHRELLKLDAKGEIPAMTVLLAHAQDHLMTSALAQDLIQEMILLYQK